MSYNLLTVSAGLSNPSSTRLLADRLTESTRLSLEEQGRLVNVTILELRDSAQDTLATMLSGFSVGNAKEVLSKVQETHGLILVTPLFNGTFSGLFKMFMDIIPNGTLAGKPVLLGATGGTSRHSLAIDFALRPLMSYLKADVMPTAVFAATDDWASPDTVNPLPERITKAGNELAHTMVGGTAGSVVRPTQVKEAEDEFSNVPDFASMLNSLSS